VTSHLAAHVLFEGLALLASTTTALPGGAEARTET
jgi:hypothetical protein